MKLFTIISNAQSGKAFLHLGQHFGLSDEMAALTVRYTLPAMRKAIERRTETAEGLIAVLEFLGSRRCDRVMQDPRMFGHVRVESEGQAILKYLFGSSQHIRKLIDSRAKILPIEAERLEKMLPYIAVMAIGAIEQRTRRPLGAVLNRLKQTALQPRDLHNPYASLAVHLADRKRELESRWRGGRISALLSAVLPRSETRTAGARSAA